MNSANNGQTFWREAFAIQGSITPRVMPYVLVCGAFACVICLTSWLTERWFSMDIGLEVAPFELAGAVLGLLLILRTNSGYDRWWEARKLWGGIVNQSRNTAISAVAYGPNDPAWREKFVCWTAAFPHVARCSLRGQPPAPAVAALVGIDAAARLGSAGHMPSYVVLRLAEILREACERYHMDRFAFIQIDRERAALIDHIGGCERILKSPLPRVYSIKIRRFIALFLLTLPFALLHRLSNQWLIPLITIMVAYPMISLDQIGVELQNPFSTTNLSHLPLDDISKTIEMNLRDLLQIEQLTREPPRNELQNNVASS